MRVRHGYRFDLPAAARELACRQKRVYRIDKAEGQKVRTKQRVKRASQPRVPLPEAETRSHRYLVDFIVDKLVDRRRFRVLTLIDHFDRCCAVLYVDQSMRGQGH